MFLLNSLTLKWRHSRHSNRREKSNDTASYPRRHIEQLCGLNGNVDCAVWTLLCVGKLAESAPLSAKVSCPDVTIYHPPRNWNGAAPSQRCTKVILLLSTPGRCAGGLDVKFHLFLISVLNGIECLASRPSRFTPGNELWYSWRPRLVRPPEPAWMVLEKRKISCHCQSSNLEPFGTTVVSVPTALLWLPSRYCTVVYQLIDRKMDFKWNEVKICTPLQMLHFRTTQLATGN
jgi:hypothetical protein